MNDTYILTPEVEAMLLARAQSALQALLQNVSSTFCAIPEAMKEGLLCRAASRLERIPKRRQGEAIPQERSDALFRQSELVTKGAILSHSERVNSTPNPFLAYFFCDNTSEHRSDLAHVLRSLLRQFLTRTLPFSGKAARQFLANFKEQEGTEWLKSVEALWMKLEEIFQWAPLNDIIFIVDGLDECNESSLEAFLTLLSGNGRDKHSEDAGPTKPRIRWIFLSRRSGLSPENFGPTIMVADLEQYSVPINDVVRKFIDNEVKELARIKRYTDELQSSTAEVLRRKAEGTFLWVSLACRELRRPKVRSIHVLALLERLPIGLTQLYSRMYDQVMANEFPEMTRYVIQILKAVVFATRPLTIGEVAVVAGLPTDAWENEKVAEEYLEQCESFLSVRFHDSVTVGGNDDPGVHLVHQSAKDFLLSGKEGGIFPADCAIEHEAIALRCIKYIDSIAEISLCPTSPPFANLSQLYKHEYPLKQWLDHGLLASERLSTSQNVHCKLFCIGTKLHREWMRKYGWMLPGGPFTISMLHLAISKKALWLFNGIWTQAGRKNWIKKTSMEARHCFGQ